MRVLHGVTAVAALKLPGATWAPWTACWVLHGVTAVAALKHQPHRQQPGRQVVLHGVTAVAALKHVMDHQVQDVLVRVLHGVTAVAALKLLPWPTGGLATGRSPRRHCRGRIEA